MDEPHTDAEPHAQPHDDAEASAEAHADTSAKAHAEPTMVEQLEPTYDYDKWVEQLGHHEKQLEQLDKWLE